MIRNSGMEVDLLQSQSTVNSSSARQRCAVASGHGYGDRVRHRALGGKLHCADRQTAGAVASNRILPPFPDLPPAPRAGRVSIVISSYNHAQDIGAVQSAPGQRAVAVEVIVVDNSSTDGSRQVLERHADRAQLILQEDAGGLAKPITPNDARPRRDRRAARRSGAAAGAR